MKFTETKLRKEIQNAIKKAGYEEMTPIQEKAIPVVLDGNDILACAQTGTGKTAAFALPVLHKLAPDRKPNPRALILTPTRELAMQIFDNCKKYGRYMKLYSACVYGGAPQKPQIRKLEKGCDILIATPGRLLDFVSREIIDLSDVEIFVLDEADRMLDMGFIPDIRKVESLIAKDRQTLMFSATMPKQIEQLALDLLDNPVDVRVAATSSPADTVEQRLCFVGRDDKVKLLVDYLNREEVLKSIVFTRTKYGADKLVKQLNRKGIKALAIHGNKSQGQRKDALDRFRSGNIKVLVATDVASRGIDIPKISHVFNYELPDEAESYIHRIGRAGRAGENGIAISMCSPDEVEVLAEVEKLLERQIEEEETQWSVPVTRLKKNGRNKKYNKQNNRGNKNYKSRTNKPKNSQNRAAKYESKKSHDGKSKNNGHNNGKNSNYRKGNKSRSNIKNNHSNKKKANIA
ncbi:MAG: DEAD/DEAH box helicase [Lachnospiraceae bacterium]|nr:DEAD/DEAH box helicase [Lachnospiraceae bacterium]